MAHNRLTTCAQLARMISAVRDHVHLTPECEIALADLRSENLAVVEALCRLLSPGTVATLERAGDQTLWSTSTELESRIESIVRLDHFVDAAQPWNAADFTKRVGDLQLTLSAGDWSGAARVTSRLGDDVVQATCDARGLAHGETLATVQP